MSQTPNICTYNTWRRISHKKGNWCVVYSSSEQMKNLSNIWQSFLLNLSFQSLNVNTSLRIVFIYFFKEILASLLNHCEQKWMCISSHSLCRIDCIAKQLHFDIRYLIFWSANCKTDRAFHSDANLNKLLKLSHSCTTYAYWPFTVNMNSFMVIFPKWHVVWVGWLNKALHGNCFLRKCLFVVKRENATCEYRNKLELFC